MIRSQSRRKALRVGLDISALRLPLRSAGSEAKTARSRPVSTAIGVLIAKCAALTSPARALNYPLGFLPIGSKRTAMNTSITVSERAARRIGDILKGEPSGTMLRVSVEGGGCSGFQYRFDMDRTRAADDLVISRDGAVILIDPISVNYMAGSEIDFVDDLIGASFKINNPKAKASCGCGTSFAL